jgi:hypothetical protein
MFFECPCSLAVWQTVASWSGCNGLNPSNWTEEEDLEDRYTQTFGTGDKKGQTLVILTPWSIWNWRNDIIFRGLWKTTQATVTAIKETAQQWCLAGCSALRPPMIDQVVSE